MRKIIYLIIFATSISCNTSKNLTITKINKMQSLETTTKIITELSSDEMEGRKPSSEGMKKAIDYVENYFTEIGIKPFFGNSFKDTLTIYRKETYNIVGIIESDQKSNEYILLGAHLDHLGKSSRNKTDSVYNGANDNASGVSAVLQIASVLKKYKFNKNIILVLFTAEEMGLIGSEHLAKKLKEKKINLKYVMNFDMIASPYIKGNEGLYISGSERSNMSDEINKALDKEFLLKFEGSFFDIFQLSDNYPFYKEFNIPSHTFCTYNFNNYEHYHRLSDEVINLDLKYLNNVINTSTLAIIKLLNNNTEIVLTEEK